MIDVRQIKKLYNNGVNVSAYLRDKFHSETNSFDIVEMTYDVQAGSYIDIFNKDRESSEAYAAGFSKLIVENIEKTDTVLDVGTGEMTVLSLIAKNLELCHLFAFDISFSRIYAGLKFAREHMGPNFSKLQAFVADISKIPLLPKSVDVTLSAHALEINGGRERELLTEIFRVTKKKAILFEPSYEDASDEGKARMDRLRYIKGMEDAIKDAGGILENKVRLEETAISNPLNPTFCYIIRPPSFDESFRAGDSPYSDPGRNDPLTLRGNFYYSPVSGYSYPILEGVPILTTKNAILSTILTDE